MDYEKVIYEKPEPGIARITLNSPERYNALSVQMVEDFYGAAEQAATDPEVSVVIYRGAGKSFWRKHGGRSEGV